MQQRLHCIISGRVQGVFYRDFARRNARKRGLTGFVRNLPDGTVEVVAEGEKDGLEQLLKALAKGPLFAAVEKVETQWKEATGTFENFRISYASLMERL